MPTSTNITNLIINELTEAQYDSAVQGGTIGANEISILTDVSGASYTAGTGIDITSNTISVASPIAQLEVVSGNSVGSVYGMWASTTITSPYRCLVLGHSARITSASATGSVVLGAQAVGGNGTISIGASASATVADGIAVGVSATSSALGAVQIGYGTNSTSNTLQFLSYPLVSSDGTIPEARLASTTSATAGQVLTLDNNLNATWATPSGGGSSTSATATLATADWSSNTQTVSVTGVTASNNVIVAAAPASQSAWTAAGVICTAQGAGTLTFTCTTTPSVALTANILIL